jgi:hypothetical protein
LAWLAIAATEQYARSGRRAALLAGTASAILMIETRQILLPFVPLLPVLGLLRARFAAARQPSFWIATAVLLGAVLLRLFDSAQESDQVGHMASIWPRLAHPDAIALAVMRNPIVDLPRFAVHLLPLYVIGAVWLIRHSWAGRFLIVAALWLFASSLWLYEGQNVAFMFRLPALTVWLFVAGLGAWRCAELVLQSLPGVPAPRWSIAVYAGTAAALCFAPVLQPGWAILREQRPLTREYEYIRDMVPRLPREFTLVSGVPSGAAVPAYEFPYHLFADAGVVVHRSGNHGPRLFLHGVFCRAYSLVELLGAQHGYDLFILPPDEQRRVFAALGRTDSQGFAVPAEDRQECRRLLAGATPIVEPRRINAMPHDPPFVMFGVDDFAVQFYELPPEAAAER